MHRARVGLVGFCIGWWLPTGADAVQPRLGAKAPAIHAVDWFNVKRPLSLKALAGRIVVVEFWATRYEACTAVVPYMNALHDRWKDKGVVIIGLTHETAREAKPFVRDMKMRYVIGTGSTSAGRYDVQAIPHAFVIDPKGRLVWSGHPRLQLEETIERVFKQMPPELISKKRRAQLENDLSEARRALQRGAAGRSYRLAARIMDEAPEFDSLYAGASEIVEKLDEIADTRFEEAAAGLDERRYAQAVDLLSSVVLDFEGSEAAAKAKEILTELKKNPEARTAMRKAEKTARARKIYERAEDDLRSKRYLESHKGLTEVVKKYPGTEYADLAKAVRDAQAKKDCTGWLNMARNYAKAGRKDKAKTYYDRVLAEYPATPYAKTAKAELGRL